MVRFRENAEGIALYHGEADEFRSFGQRFGNIVRNWWGIMRQQKRHLAQCRLRASISRLPLIVVPPRYFHGQMLPGGLMQTAAAFGQVQDSLGFIISSYTDIASWRSVVERIAGFR